jgi:1-deoxy-D-xylulose-5-phosphate reductoisomerase
MRNIIILGSTGSIGCSSLQVLSNFPERYRAAYLIAHRNIDLLYRQISEFKPKGAVVIDSGAADELRSRINGTTEILSGLDGVEEIVGRDDTDTMISSLVGYAGLRPTIRAIEAGKTIALANKETLVVAGALIMMLAHKHGVSIIPVDSEHSAILQCLAGEDRDSVAKIILTASGGPFLRRTKEELKTVTIAEALDHPNWRMGNKITIDSATLMNKGLEVIEAHHLFDLPPEKIEVIIHPQSIIHSMVEFIDGSVKAQLGVPDMKIPIQYALTYPDRSISSYERVNFTKLGSMEFIEPDTAVFPCLRLATEALREGGTAPAVLNAANEIAVNAFLKGAIIFTGIPELIERALQDHKTDTNLSLESIERADFETRVKVESYISNN